MLTRQAGFSRARDGCGRGWSRLPLLPPQPDDVFYFDGPTLALRIQILTHSSDFSLGCRSIEGGSLGSMTPLMHVCRVERRKHA